MEGKLIVKDGIWCVEYLQFFRVVKNAQGIVVDTHFLVERINLSIEDIKSLPLASENSGLVGLSIKFKRGKEDGFARLVKQEN